MKRLLVLMVLITFIAVMTIDAFASTTDEETQVLFNGMNWGSFKSSVDRTLDSLYPDITIENILYSKDKYAPDSTRNQYLYYCKDNYDYLFSLGNCVDVKMILISFYQKDESSVEEMYSATYIIDTGSENYDTDQLRELMDDKYGQSTLSRSELLGTTSYTCQWQDKEYNTARLLIQYDRQHNAYCELTYYIPKIDKEISSGIQRMKKEDEEKERKERLQENENGTYNGL